MNPHISFIGYMISNRERGASFLVSNNTVEACAPLTRDILLRSVPSVVQAVCFRCFLCFWDSCDLGADVAWAGAAGEAAVGGGGEGQCTAAEADTGKGPVGDPDHVDQHRATGGQQTVCETVIIEGKMLSESEEFRLVNANVLYGKTSILKKEKSLFFLSWGYWMDMDLGSGTRQYVF